MHPFHRLNCCTQFHQSYLKQNKGECVKENSHQRYDKDEYKHEYYNRHGNPEKDSSYKTKTLNDVPDTDIREYTLTTNKPENGNEILQSKKSNILRAKERILWLNNSTETKENPNRLGPNKKSS